MTKFETVVLRLLAGILENVSKAHGMGLRGKDVQAVRDAETLVSEDDVPKQPEELAAADGVWVLTVEPEWGSRYPRREEVTHFSSKPSKQDIAKLALSSHHRLEFVKFGVPATHMVHH